jgi:hypothetical protein
MVRYGFKIRTKTGQRVENIQILAATLVDAERRLRQMYLQCEIIERREQSVPARAEMAEVESAGARPRTSSMKSKSSTH